MIESMKQNCQFEESFLRQNQEVVGEEDLKLTYLA